MGATARGSRSGRAAAAAAAAVACAAGAAGQALESGAAEGPWWAGGAAWAPNFQIQAPQLPQFELPVWNPAAAVQQAQDAAVEAVSNYQAQVGNFYATLAERTEAAMGMNPLLANRRNGTLFGPAIPLNNWPTLQLPQFPSVPGMEVEWTFGASGAPANQPDYGQQAQALMLSQVCNVYKPEGGVNNWITGQSTIRVFDEFPIEDVRVELYAKHPRVGALRVALIASNTGAENRRAFLKVKGQGGRGENLIGTVFADSGAEFPRGQESSTEAPFTNTYAPFAEGGLKGKFKEGAGLKATNGGSAGSWTIRIEDMSANPVDPLIEDWTLTLCRNATTTPPMRLNPQEEAAEFNGVLETNIACPSSEDGCPQDDLDDIIGSIFGDETKEPTNFEAAMADSNGWTSEGAASADPEVRAQAHLGGGGSMGVDALKYWEEQSDAFFAQLQSYYDANMPSPVYNFLTQVPDQYWQMMIYYQMWSWWKDAELPAERAGKSFKGFHMPKFFPHHG